MAVDMSLALKAGISFLLLQCILSLVIKQEPHLDTEFYVGPATYTRKDGKALPSTIIISSSIGLRGDAIKDTVEDDLPQASFSLVPLEKEGLEEGSIDLRPNIKFYKIECSRGRSCTSIIPARTPTPEPPAIPFTKTELKEYLAQFGLYEGFPYSYGFENSGSPKRPDPNGNRAFGSNYHGASDYWPGSSYRPQALPSKAQVFKFQHINSDPNNRPIPDFPTRSPTTDFVTQRPFPDFLTRKPPTDFPTRRPPIKWHKIPDFPTRKPETKWEEMHAVRPFPNDRFHNPYPSQHSSRPQEFPRPFSYEDDGIIPPYGPPRPSSPPRTTSHPTPYDGVWNRYSLSTVSQLDRDTGEWVKVSSSSTKLDQGMFDFPKDANVGSLQPATHHTKASLTVLGFSDREPHSTFTDSTDSKVHTVKIPSAHPGNPPEIIETDGGIPDGDQDRD